MMKFTQFFTLLALLLAGCTPGANQGQSTATQPIYTPIASSTSAQPLETNTPAETATLEPSPSATMPPEGYGPSGFPANVNPLTGLAMSDPNLLNRRPLLIKVTNLPRGARPQWGLSLADLVFEYYTEDGGTRFAALFYGNNAEIAGPIRSARFVDAHLIRGYKASFAFGSAYSKVLDRLYSAEFSNRLVLEGDNTPLHRYDPNGANHLVVGTAELSAYITASGVENGRQNLDGMTFKSITPSAGQPGMQLYLRYSGSIYNRWDFDSEGGKYLRFVDTADDFDNHNEQYTQLVDRLNGQKIAFDNVVVLFVTTDHYNLSPEVVDIQLVGSGNGYAFRDGQAFQVSWQRGANEIISLRNTDGSPYAFKPGTTWFELLGATSLARQNPTNWRFTHYMP
jgi:hypothetical protein